MFGLTKLIDLGIKVIPYVTPLISKILPKATPTVTPQVDPVVLPSAEPMGEPAAVFMPEPTVEPQVTPKAGWKTALGWSMALVLIYSFIGRPILVYVIALVGVVFAVDVSVLPPLPTVDPTDLLRMLASLVGLGV
jgi:hypothetical protein